MPDTAQELWDAYVAKNPHWATTGANLTPAGVEKLVKAAFAHGLAARDTTSPRMGSVFEQMFGGRKM